MEGKYDLRKEVKRKTKATGLEYNSSIPLIENMVNLDNRIKKSDHD